MMVRAPPNVGSILADWGDKDSGARLAGSGRSHFPCSKASRARRADHSRRDRPRPRRAYRFLNGCRGTRRTSANPENDGGWSSVAHRDRTTNERATSGESGTELRFRFLSNYAETITEWIAAKRDRRALSAFEFLLALPARVQHVDQDTLKIVDMEIDMNRCPVSLIPANVVRSLRRLAPCPLLNQADLAAPTFENDIRRDRSSDFGETQCTTIESQSFIELRNVNCDGVVHL
jgi:hypothetical protein